MILFYLLIILLSAGGFAIATYVRFKKATLQDLVCPIGHSCDTVIHSDYSRFMGVPVEYLGMLYYGSIAFSYISLVLRPDLAAPLVSFGLLALTTVAFLFSLYLTFIQAFALRQWCTWCLISAGLSTLIFSFTLLGSEYGFITLLAEHHAVFVGLHILGIAFGLGGATISDVMFVKFLRDLRISEFEARVLHTLSQVIWFGLGLLVVSGLALYLPEAASLNQSAKFLAKMAVVAVIIVNGALLNLSIAPRLVRISFGERHDHERGELHHARQAAFAMGAVSIVSWYTAFVLGLVREAGASFSVIMAVYLAVLSVGIIASQIMERSLGRRRMPVTVREKEAHK